MFWVGSPWENTELHLPVPLTTLSPWVGLLFAGENSRCANDASLRVCVSFATWLSTTHRITHRITHRHFHFARLCSPRKNEYSNVHASPTAAASSHIMNSLSHHEFMAGAARDSEFMGAALAAGACGLCLLRICRIG